MTIKQWTIATITDSKNANFLVRKGKVYQLGDTAFKYFQRRRKQS